MSKEGIKVATCQFPVSGSLAKNSKYITDFIKESAANRADVVHFCETALTGYAGTLPELGVKVFDVASFQGYDWERLRSTTRQIIDLAGQEKIWVILGSSHFSSATEKPTNCLYIISNAGRMEDRYDKCKCTTGDLTAYRPGSRLVTTSISGVKCGYLICADIGGADLYQSYMEQGVQVLFQSFYNARYLGPVTNDLDVIPTVQARASEYKMWICANNSSARHSSWPTFVAGPDGELKKLTRHRSGILYQQIAVDKGAKRPGDLVAQPGRL